MLWLSLFYCPPETKRTLVTDYTPVQNKTFETNKSMSWICLGLSCLKIKPKKKLHALALLGRQTQRSVDKREKESRPGSKEKKHKETVAYKKCLLVSSLGGVSSALITWNHCVSELSVGGEEWRLILSVCSFSFPVFCGSECLPQFMDSQAFPGWAESRWMSLHWVWYGFSSLSLMKSHEGVTRFFFLIGV